MCSSDLFGAILSAIFLNENIFEYKNMVALVLVCIGIWMVNKEKQIVKQVKKCK